jgi:hypothetical protein
VTARTRLEPWGGLPEQGLIHQRHDIGSCRGEREEDAAAANRPCDEHVRNTRPGSVPSRALHVVRVGARE